MNKIYTVRPNDSLTRIARTAKVPLGTILALNPQVENPDAIRPGQQIVLPEAVDRSAMIVSLAQRATKKARPWFALAANEEDVAEFPHGSNPRIVEYLATCNDLSARKKADDSTAWCSAFVNWCVGLAGMSGTNSAAARSWAKWGVEDPAPTEGTIVVWKRFKGPDGHLKLVGGHVAFLLADEGERLYVLGGNQGDKVSRKRYPRNGFLKDTVSGPGEVRHRYELESFRIPA